MEIRDKEQSFGTKKRKIMKKKAIYRECKAIEYEADT